MSGRASLTFRAFSRQFSTFADFQSTTIAEKVAAKSEWLDLCDYNVQLEEISYMAFIRNNRLTSMYNTMGKCRMSYVPLKCCEGEKPYDLMRRLIGLSTFARKPWLGNLLVAE